MPPKVKIVFPLEKTEEFLYIGPMGHVFDFNDAVACERWFSSAQNLAVLQMECRLMLEMLGARQGQSILDIGCGTGECLKFCRDNGLNVTGVEPSPYMLDFAEKKLGSCADLHRAPAEDLPFDDNSFNYAFLMTSLEFVEDPVKAMEEAGRVAKDKIFVGIINRYALKRIEIGIKSFFSETIYKKARFYSIWEIKKIARDLLGDVPVTWQSIPVFPSFTAMFRKKVANLNIAQKFPFGAFVGISVTVMPRYRTRPLELEISPNRTASVVPGLTSDKSGT